MKTIVVLEQPEINQFYSEDGFLMTLANGQQIVMKAEKGIGAVYGPLKLGAHPITTETVELEMPAKAKTRPKRRYTRRKLRVPAQPKSRGRHGRPGKFQCPTENCERGFRTSEHRATHLRKDHPEHLSDAA
jgi:hypothetical protein